MLLPLLKSYPEVPWENPDLWLDTVLEEQAMAGHRQARAALKPCWVQTGVSRLENVAAQSLHPHVPHPRHGQGQAVKRNMSCRPGKLMILSFIVFLLFLLFGPASFPSQALCLGKSDLG